MKLFASFFLLSVPFLAHATSPTIAGTWRGTATVHGQQVPLTLSIAGSGNNLKAALINGPEQSQASSVTLEGNHLVVAFNYFARKFDATLIDGTLSGTFGTVAANYPVTAKQAAKPVAAKPAPNAPDIHGEWEIATKSSKGEAAWQLRVSGDSKSEIHAVIQRIDGDTGSLFGTWDGQTYAVSHLSAAGPALYSLTPQPDGTLLVSNLLRADIKPKPEQQNLVARRPAEARKQNLPAPTDSAQQTSVKDPSVPFAFSFPDVSGKIVSNTDPQFDGKVVIVAIGGSWCPNCHDEAPFLVNLYEQFHSRGLEIVSLSFEEEEHLKDPERIHAFITRYGIPYNVLLAGQTDQLNEKLPQAVNLNCWPTTFFLGRDGLVKEVHAGFAGPANPPAHEALKQEVTDLIEHLLAEPVPVRTASATQ
ncbi:TlpA disulfide reductase family protein [Granulicella sp. dw_53]|uniref:peroxiredoxin family protein n=1 Tax=Granulicella sp. dw_53 TaxID=2719792 RepID=UPI001BD21DE0|nr:TlpA disulfide reductase family protein [Granulicella sp. dw_53]